MDEEFFSRKFSSKVFRRGSRMQFWPVCWENLVRSLRKSFNFSTCLFVYLHFFHLWFDWSWKFPFKKLFWTRKMSSPQNSRKKNLLEVQKLLCSNSQKSCRNVLIKIFFCFKVPSGQLKCSFQNPAAKFSPGVSKSLPQCRIENIGNFFFQKSSSSEICSGHLDRNFDIPTEKKAESPTVVRPDSGKRVI